jgi:hypothetical protein
MLVDAVFCLYKGMKPDLSWLTQHKFLPVPSTPVIRYGLIGINATAELQAALGKCTRRRHTVPARVTPS